MAIHVRHLEELRRLAYETRSPTRREPGAARCARCVELGAAVLRLASEVEQLRAPYATAFRDGASGALDFAARAFEAMGEARAASLVRAMRSVVEK